MQIAAIIPVAGLSTRMGVFKPLISLQGKPLLLHAVHSLQEGGVTDIVAVTGHRANELPPLPDGVRLIHNDHFAQTDMMYSLALGLSALSAEAVCILPGDMPAVSGQTVSLLRATFQNASMPIVRPVYQGKCGHPPFLSAALLRAFLSAKQTGGLRALLASHTEETLFLPVDDRGILLDANYPKDIAALS